MYPRYSPGAPRRTRHAGDAAQGQRTLNSAFSRCPRPPCSKPVARPLSSELRRAGCLDPLTNRADFQRDTGGGFAAGCLDTMATAGFLDTVEEGVEFCPTKTSELTTTTPGSCAYQLIALPSDHVSLVLKSRSILGLSFTTGKGQAQSRGASFWQPGLDEVLPQMVPIRCIFVRSQESWREPLKRGQRIKLNDARHGCPGLVCMP